MRTIAILSLVFLVSCSKGSDETPGGDPITFDNTIPSSVTVNTGVSIYFDNGNNPLPGSFGLYDYPGSFPLQNDCYTSPPSIQTDKYKTSVQGITIGRSFPGYAVTYRHFPVSSALHNFVDTRRVVDFFGPAILGNSAPGWIYYLDFYTGTDTGNKLLYGTGSFDQDDEVIYNFFNPSNYRYAIDMPDMTVDRNDKRWFLKSFGAYTLKTPPINLSAPPVYLEYPIPANLLSEAGDSIEYWHSVGGDWTFKGFAHRVNNSFRARIDKALGVWCFAKPVKGLYKTIKLRTDQSVPVTNALFRIKSGVREVWAGRTDSDGNAICFLPTEEQLTVEIIFEWKTVTSSPPAFTLPIAAFSDSREVQLSIPASSYNVITLKGSVTKCGGSAVNNGFIKIIRYDLKKTLQTYLPVKNGQVNSAFIAPANNPSVTPYPYIAKATDMTQNKTGSDTVLILNMGVDNVTEFSSCALPSNLYANYTIDGTSYSIVGDTSHFAAPALFADVHTIGITRYVILSCSNNGIGFSVDIGGLWAPGTNLNAPVHTVFINGIYQTPFSDATRKPMLSISRYDAVDGYMIGNAKVYYKDNAGVVHELVASFKLKRLT